MAIVTSLRFTENSGAIAIDQESWHIWRRKNWFTDHLYVLVPEHQSDKFNIDLVYGGVGHPPFHCEVTKKARFMIDTFLSDPETDPESITLEAFHFVHSRRVNDKLNYLYGFDRSDLNSGTFLSQGKMHNIAQKNVIDRSIKIVRGKESIGYSPLSPPVEACLIGIDKKYGFSAFAIKEEDGVLGFQSCWFESLGIGRDGAASKFAKFMNNRFLDSRREGEGISVGLLHLLDATCESMDHYGQNGGFIRFIILKGDGQNQSERVLDIKDDSARLSVEITRAFRAGIIPSETAVNLLSEIIDNEARLEIIEQRLFQTVDDPVLLGKLLRGYKIPEGNLGEAGPERRLFTKDTIRVTASKGESK